MNLSKGLCGRTHHNQADCEAGDRGVLPAPLVPATGGWAALARECAGLCRACARCNVVSFSLAERECDWFHDCDPSILKTVDKPWKTLVVNQLQPPPERFVSYYNVPFRSHTAVRWSGSTVRLYIVNDWSAEWVLQESHSEYAVTRIFRRLASDCADRDTLILDVGANSGYYSLLSAALGCQVVAFEPQPGCHTRLKAAIGTAAPRDRAERATDADDFAKRMRDSLKARSREGKGGFNVTSTCEFSDEMCQRKCPLFENSTRDDLSSKNESKRVKTDRDTSLERSEKITLFRPRSSSASRRRISPSRASGRASRTLATTR